MSLIYVTSLAETKHINAETLLSKVLKCAEGYEASTEWIKC